MAKGNKSIVGIDIGSHSIKLFHENILGKFVGKRVPFPSELTRRQYLAFIKNQVVLFIKENDLNDVSMNFTIRPNTGNGNVEFMNIPKINKKNFNKALRYEMEDRPQEDNFNSYQILWDKVDEKIEDNKISYISGLMKKDLIDTLSDLKKISWTIESLEFQPITLGRFIEGTSVVIDYGNQNTMIYFYLKGILNKISTIPSGGARINDIIREVRPEATPDELEQIKKELFFYAESDEHYISTPKLDPAYDAALEINMHDLSNLDKGFDKDMLMEISIKATEEVRYITEEAKNLIRGFELEHEVIVTNAYFNGQTFSLTDFAKFISNETNMDIRHISSLISSKEIRDHYEEFAVAHISRGYAEKKYLYNLNFQKHIKNNFDSGSLLVAAVILSTLLHAGFYHIHNVYDEKISTFNEELNKQAALVSQLTSQIESYRNETNSLYSDNEWKDQIDRERVNFSEFLYHLPKITPNGVAMDKITIKKNQIFINGYSKNYTDVGFLAIELEKIGGIKLDKLERGTVDEPAKSVTIKNLLEGGKEEKFETTNAFTMTITVDFPIQTSFEE